MAEAYLNYIPIISANPFANAVILTFLPGIFYVLAAYGHLLVSGMGLGVSIVMSIIFASLEYLVRVPIIKYSSEVAGMSNTTLQMVWVAITMFLSWISDKYMIKTKTA